MRRRWIPFLLFVLFMPFAGCQNGPTAPTAGKSADGGLTGIWSATVTFDDPACGAAEKVQSQILQFSNSLSVTVATRCYGPLTFHGFGSESHYAGTVSHRCGVDDPYAQGPVVAASWSATTDGHHFLLQASAAKNGICSLPGITVDLTR